MDFEEVCAFVINTRDFMQTKLLEVNLDFALKVEFVVEKEQNGIGVCSSWIAGQDHLTRIIQQRVVFLDASKDRVLAMGLLHDFLGKEMTHAVSLVDSSN